MVWGGQLVADVKKKKTVQLLKRTTAAKTPPISMTEMLLQRDIL